MHFFQYTTTTIMGTCWTTFINLIRAGAAAAPPIRVDINCACFKSHVEADFCDGEEEEGHK